MSAELSRCRRIALAFAGLDRPLTARAAAHARLMAGFLLLTMAALALCVALDGVPGVAWLVVAAYAFALTRLGTRALYATLKEPTR